MITTTPALFGSLCVDQSSFKIASKFFLPLSRSPRLYHLFWKEKPFQRVGLSFDVNVNGRPILTLYQVLLTLAVYIFSLVFFFTLRLSFIVFGNHQKKSSYVHNTSKCANSNNVKEMRVCQNDEGRHR